MWAVPLGAQLRWENDLDVAAEVTLGGLSAAHLQPGESFSMLMHTVGLGRYSWQLVGSRQLDGGAAVGGAAEVRVLPGDDVTQYGTFSEDDGITDGLTDASALANESASMRDDSSLLDASSKYADSVEGGSVEDASATDGQTDDGSVYSINLPPTDTEVTTDAEATDSSAPASPKRRPPRRALLSSLEPVEGTPELAEPTPSAEAAEAEAAAPVEASPTAEPPPLVEAEVEVEVAEGEGDAPAPASPTEADDGTEADTESHAGTEVDDGKSVTGSVTGSTRSSLSSRASHRARPVSSVEKETQAGHAALAFAEHARVAMGARPTAAPPSRRSLVSRRSARPSRRPPPPSRRRRALPTTPRLS